jgi:hypothetical protein
LCSNLHPILKHGEQFLLLVIKLRRGQIARVREFRVGQKHDGGLLWLVAAEKRGALVDAFGHEGGDVGDGGHAGQAGSFGFVVGVDDFGAVGPVVVCVGGVVVDDDYVDGAGGLEERPDGVVLVG